MKISETKINMLKNKEKEAYNRIVEIQNIRLKRILTITEDRELKERWAYYNGMRTVLDELELDI